MVEFADFNLSQEHPMTDDRMALLDALQKADDGNFLRVLAETVLQILMEADVEGVIGCRPIRTLRRAHDLAQWLS